MATEIPETLARRLAEERAAQKLWRPRPGVPAIGEFDVLVDNEFAPAGRIDAVTRERLSAVLRFAAANVPYYRDLTAQSGITAAALEHADAVLALPVLTKQTFQDNAAAFRAERLPKGHKPAGATLSSGTTGRATRVLQTNASMRMFSILKQREYRWFRFDPMGKLAAIRTAQELRKDDTQTPIADGETYRAPAWRYVGAYFKTGPYVGFKMTNPVDKQLVWLEREKPDYLMALPGTLEHLAHAAGGANPAPGIKGLLAISGQMPAVMRRRIETGFGVAPRLNYGLNEIGLVAAQCETGRYHVHVEHCCIEIVDERGQPCAPGETGSLLVSTLDNLLMPLIRYDTGDLAVAAERECPCGRTLPSFGAVSGRYRRFVGLPEGTFALVLAVRSALEDMPEELARNVRLYQFHQYRDGRYELRFAVEGPLPEEFRRRLRAAWESAADESQPLAIVEMDSIPCAPSGKFNDFTSDFLPETKTGEVGD